MEKAEKSHERRAIVIGGSIASLFVGAFLRRIGWLVDIVRKDLIAQMRAEAENLLPPQYLDCLRHIDQPFFTPVYDFCSPKLMFGRVALVGDAASTPRPHMGFGVSKAGAEAQALAEALLNYHNIDRALAAYNAARQPLSERIVSHGRKLGMQLGVGIETDEDRRFAKSLQSPKGILDWIAVPSFLASVCCRDR